MCVCVCVYMRENVGFYFLRPVEQKYGRELESIAAGSHSEEPCRIPSGIIGTGKQVIDRIALNSTLLSPVGRCFLPQWQCLVNRRTKIRWIWGVEVYCIVKEHFTMYKNPDTLYWWLLFSLKYLKFVLMNLMVVKIKEDKLWGYIVYGCDFSSPDGARAVVLYFIPLSEALTLVFQYTILSCQCQYAL